MPTTPFVPSPEQKKVIAHRGSHLQVIACAGAGETEAISRRVSFLIEEGVEPAQIVAFTFTERPAAGLKNRIARRIAESKGNVPHRRKAASEGSTTAANASRPVHLLACVWTARPGYRTHHDRIRAGRQAGRQRKS